ncbi:hypothetical protein EGW08_021092 [Elysia chlorotica]|uniref:ISXO2-like transposase domain-containing protein n=1 Tax=Elysia chlorotica TaxID=188477 RepID=A0A3S0ZBI4_ELYCH|nr:hypothetical protein EGW08_021092 [Elysia chlorotica]
MGSRACPGRSGATDTGLPAESYQVAYRRVTAWKSVKSARVCGDVDDLLDNLEDLQAHRKVEVISTPTMEVEKPTRPTNADTHFTNHVGIEGNEMADELVKIGLGKGRSMGRGRGRGKGKTSASSASCLFLFRRKKQLDQKIKIFYTSGDIARLLPHKSIGITKPLVCLGLSKHTVVDWRSFCSEVTDEWYRKQSPIGGPGVVVEIDETLITRRKYNRGRLPTQIWPFGGIERVTKRKFIVPLTGDVAENRTKETLLPLITKYIVKGSVIYSDAFRSYHTIKDLGSVIYSDAFRSYHTLKDLGYTHCVVNHSKNFVDPEDPNVHTQNIERLWKDVKSWVKRPVIRSKYLYQYLGRYFFATSHELSTPLHHFFIQAAKLYPPQSDRSPTANAELSDSFAARSTRPSSAIPSSATSANPFPWTLASNPAGPSIPAPAPVSNPAGIRSFFLEQLKPHFSHRGRGRSARVQRFRYGESLTEDDCVRRLREEEAARTRQCKG